MSRLCDGEKGADHVNDSMVTSTNDLESRCFDGSRDNNCQDKRGTGLGYLGLYPTPRLDQLRKECPRAVSDGNYITTSNLTPPSSDFQHHHTTHDSHRGVLLDI